MQRAAAEQFSKLPYFDEVNVRVASYENPKIAGAMKALDLTGDAPRGDRRLQAIKKRRDLERRIAERLIQLEGRIIDGFVLVRDKEGWCRIIPISKEAA